MIDDTLQMIHDRHKMIDNQMTDDRLQMIDDRSQMEDDT